MAISPFISWLTDPRPGRGIHFADDSGGWHYVEWAGLAASARRVATELISEGVRPGDVVCLIMPTGRPCLAALFGAWAAGATVSPLVPPALQPDEDYIAHVASIAEQAEPALTITGEEYEPLVGRALKQAGLARAPWIFREGTTEAEPRTPGDIAVLQFTSGSSGEPRGVRVSWDNLGANLEITKRLYRWEDGAGCASWLPLYHDMGLIGMLFFATATQEDFWLMRPDQFIRNPLQWVACFDRGKARITASPSFPYAYIARKLRPEQLTGLDLSEWRAAIIGAEAIDVSALESFARFAAPAGFSRRTYAPAYGLAENTLAVMGARQEQTARIARPDWGTMRFGEPVSVRETAVLGDVTVEADAGWIAGHGLPYDEVDVTVRVVDGDGEPLPEGSLGEIVVGGASVAKGYHRGYEGKSTRFVDGELRTGDAGFLHEGEYYILGRMGDSLKLSGRTVYVEDLEGKVAAVTGLNKGRLAVVSIFEGHRAGFAVFAEAEPDAWMDAAAGLLRRQFGQDPPITLVSGSHGLVARTSSGKTRRRHMWQQLQHGPQEGVTIVRR
ncbi:MAG: AMP-dependent synthetase and ligase [Sphaerisporangium sp.]|nr:AMP-dependent synthetase and ligase [Sphaerisporangium sp.]